MMDSSRETYWDKQPYVFYALRDPRTDETRYVGRSREWQARYRRLAHLRGTHGTPEKRAWVAELKALGLEPVFVVLQCSPHDGPSAFRRERWWVAYWHKRGARLLNGDHLSARRGSDKWTSPPTSPSTSGTSSPPEP